MISLLSGFSICAQPVWAMACFVTCNEHFPILPLSAKQIGLVTICALGLSTAMIRTRLSVHLAINVAVLSNETFQIWW